MEGSKECPFDRLHRKYLLFSNPRQSEGFGKLPMLEHSMPPVFDSPLSKLEGTLAVCRAHADLDSKRQARCGTWCLGGTKNSNLFFSPSPFRSLLEILFSSVLIFQHI